MSTLLITGASRGLGHAFNVGLPQPGDILWLVSRTQPKLDLNDGVTRHWIEADLSQVEAATEIAAALNGQPLDTLIYNAGVWERNAFSNRYNLDQVPQPETLNILNINLTSALLCVQQLLPNLKKSDTSKIIFIGSTSGMENPHVPEVAYNASKFGLRGLAQTLRENLRADRIPVTVLNPGTIASTESPYELGREAALAATRGTMIPMHDLVAIVRCLLNLSNATCVKEMDIPAMADTNA